MELVHYITNYYVLSFSAMTMEDSNWSPLVVVVVVA